MTMVLLQYACSFVIFFPIQM
uniref:Uncharacterized protein n=1 Tax=Arundo donax TaxID=35708 RepID=A0A0A9F0A7_ARUDO